MKEIYELDIYKLLTSWDQNLMPSLKALSRRVLAQFQVSNFKFQL